MCSHRWPHPAGGVHSVYVCTQIILIAGDADFIPAAKLARHEGIDFILDPMWHGIAPDLHEHIDGLQSVCPRPF